METPILQYAGGVIAAKLDRTEKELVHGVSFHISRGESLALIGETGSGKTLIAQSVMGVLPGNVRLVSGEVLFCGKALPKGKKLRSMLGREIVYMDGDFHEMFDVKDAPEPIPEEARIFKTVTCSVCGERFAESFAHLQNGEIVCSACYRPYTRGL